VRTPAPKKAFLFSEKTEEVTLLRQRSPTQKPVAESVQNVVLHKGGLNNWQMLKTRK
jgi:hypothetical protein